MDQDTTAFEGVLLGAVNDDMAMVRPSCMNVVK